VDGLNTAVLYPSPLLTEYVPGTLVELDPALTVKVDEVIDELSIGSLKVAVTLEVTDTLEDPDFGIVLINVGRVVSAAEAVVNDHCFGAVIAFPAVSLTPARMTAV
jgi:hypothetical protein